MTDGAVDVSCAVAELAEPPHQLQPPAHRLHRRADPLEGQGFPGREDRHLARTEPYPDLVRQPVGDGAARNSHNDGPTRTAARHGRDGIRLSCFPDGNGPLRADRQRGEGAVSVRQR